MMNILSKLFSSPAKAGNRLKTPLYSAEHPAYKEIQGIEELLEKTIDVKISGNTPLFSGNSVHYGDIMDLFSKALGKAPDDPDLLYARASVNYFYLQGGDGKADRDRVLEICPSHFDAMMSRDHFQTWETLPQLPTWNEKKSTIPELIATNVATTHYAQIVRDNLRSAFAIVVPWSPGIDLKGCTKIRWELKWVDTPHGKLAAHYLFLNNAKFQEMFIPHLSESEARVNHNYWMLRRLADEKYCFIVITSGKSVLWNERYMFPSALQNTLQRLGNDLKKDGPASSMVKCQNAAQWYMNNSDINALKY